MILLLGKSGYIARAFIQELQRRGVSFKAISRGDLDYARFELLLAHLRKERPDFVINCAGYTGKPNVDSCESARADTLIGNALLPATIAHACGVVDVPWGHISSGCIYSGARVEQAGEVRVEPDLMRPEVRVLVEAAPSAIHGFREDDEPNFSFRQPPCSFYSGSKALGEEVLAGLAKTYVWRLRIPFDEMDGPRNYLSKVQAYPKVYDNVNSLSHRRDFARACLDLWEREAPFGTYNVTNPGFVTTRRVIALIESYLRPARRFEFWQDDAEFYRVAAKTPRSNCVLDVTKLLAAGVKIRPVEEALIDALMHWTPRP